MDVRRLVVAADDRTGALETAGSIADAGLAAVMVPWQAGPDASKATGQNDHALSVADALVIDLASRHSEASVAASRTSTTLAIHAPRRAHKIDSTLRGNWAHELGALMSAGHRVLLIPAFPAAGRTCVAGTVYEHGVPITERHAGIDVRAPVRSSRPVDHLRRAGVSAVVALVDAAAARRWLGGDSDGFVAVCDAATDDDLRSLCEAWVGADSGVVLAGTAAAIGAGAAAIAVALAATGPSRIPPGRPALPRPALVVAGSAYPIVRAQTDALAATGAIVHCVDTVDPPTPARSASVVVLRAPPAPEAVTDSDALATARALAVHTEAWMKHVAFATLVIVGGDTAAAVLGDSAMAVGGTLAPGMPWCRRIVDGSATGPLVVTKPGGFGDADTLVRLLAPMVGADGQT